MTDDCCENDCADSSCCDDSPVVLPNDDRAEELAMYAWALAHPARVRILRLLLTRESCVCGEIVGEMPLAQSTVSQHLKILKESGLVKGEVSGPKVCYCVDLNALAKLKHLVGTLTPLSPSPDGEPAC